MLNKLKEILGTNQFVPTSDIFPQIDFGRLQKQLNPAKKGKQRALSDLPASDSEVLDSVENDIVNVIGNLRQQGIDKYHEHKTVYINRLSDVSTARTAIETSTKQAPGTFEGARQEFETHLQESTERLKACKLWQLKFKKKHGIERAAYRYKSGKIRWVFLGLLMVIVESILNGPLLAQKHELGLLGGGITAVLISMTNVVFSSLTGFYSRYINHLKMITKIFGMFILGFWFLIILVFNFGVAHFRDGVVSNLSWDDAAINAIDSIQTPLQLTSIESWLLIIIGCLISILALLKGYYADDPYPGYGNVERELDKARQNYAQDHTETLEGLESRRDQIVEEMKEAEEFVRMGISEAKDVLYGTRSLDEKFSENQRHCNEVVQQLLQIYRDSNIENRKSPPPKYFNTKYSFKKIPLDPPDIEKMAKPLKEMEHIEKLVSRASKTVNQLWNKSHENFSSAREIEDDVIDNFILHPREISHEI